MVGSNTEYHVPEAIHGETSLLNHVTSLHGKERPDAFASSPSSPMESVGAASAAVIVAITR